MIFCVEDDNGIRDLMVYALTTSGFKAEGFTTGRELFAALQTQEMPELIMLDIMLPEENGITILKRIRTSPSTEKIPVIMATAKGEEYDRVIGLDLGADDYLSKPFGMMEMVSRVKAVLRRTRTDENVNVLKICRLSMNIRKHIVTADGTRVKLTLKEYELLKLFMENPGRAFNREQLLQNIWGPEYVGETRTVDVHIGTLRQKLGSCGDYIRTVRGVGYRMEADL
jgi:two-component system alkaline phosphatase synthesis response regulator PhoP